MKIMLDGENRAAEALRRLFRSHPRITVTTTPGVVTVDVAYRYGVSRLFPIWAGEGFPRDVRAALENRASTVDSESTLVLVAARMSRGAREWLEGQGVSWADETGSASIETPSGLLVDRVGRSGDVKPAAGRRAWTAGSGVVAEVLLEEYLHARVDRVPRIDEVAERAKLSPAQVSRTLQMFDDNGWTTKSEASRGPSARRIWADVSGALSGWAAWYRRQHRESIALHGVLNVDEAIDMVRRLPVGSWLVSGWFAAEEVSPLVTSFNDVFAYIEASFFDHELRSFADDNGLREVNAGAKLRLARAQPHLFSSRQMLQSDLCSVGNVRLYGDLLKAGVRGQDAADQLRETVLGV